VPEDVPRASEIEEQNKISFWDALIVTAAVKGGAARILSEDLNPGQVIAGIPIDNPFA
jgi:predicted nucleic acid-binding protein